MQRIYAQMIGSADSVKRRFMLAHQKSGSPLQTKRLMRCCGVIAEQIKNFSLDT